MLSRGKWGEAMNVKSKNMMRSELEHYVSYKISAIQGGLLGARRSSEASRKLAVLRREVAKCPGSNLDAWAIIFEEIPECLVGKGSNPSSAEWAIHAALTLYAVHQQSQVLPMHQNGKEHNLGSAVRTMVIKNPQSYSSLKDGEMPRRFAALATAGSLTESLHYARQLVQQLRASAIPLDYGRLAGQFYDLQNPAKADGVKLEWGRGYSRAKPVIESAEAQNIEQKN